MPHDPAALTRRGFAKVLAGAAGAAVVGLNVGSGSWVAAAGRPPGDPFVDVPRLDGTLSVDAATCAAYAQDFGQIVSELPVAVLRPGSVRDVSRMLRFARRHDVRVVGRGAAHTTYGQSQHTAGIVFDLTTFDAIGPIAGGRVTMGAGARWRDVLAATLAETPSLMPAVLPDYIGQTVGGTLSVGGIGAMSFRSGAQIDHVERLLAVTGDGQIVECSAHRHRELFEMLLAGQGQVGVIVEATMRVLPAPTTVRVYDLLYPDLDSLLADLGTLMLDARFDQMEAFGFPVGGGAYGFLLEAVAYHGAGAAPDDGSLLAGLAAITEQSSITDLPFTIWANRVGEQTTRPHPWIDLVLPMSGASTFLTEVQAALAPVADGDVFSLLMIPLRSSTFTRPLFRAPGEDLVIGFDTLRSVPPGTDVTSVLAFNRRLYDRCRELGGTAYPISAVDLDVDDWRRHYGDQWSRLRAAKRRFDSCDVLASGPDVLGR